MVNIFEKLTIKQLNRSIVIAYSYKIFGQKYKIYLKTVITICNNDIVSTELNKKIMNMEKSSTGMIR